MLLAFVLLIPLVQYQKAHSHQRPSAIIFSAHGSLTRDFGLN